MMRYLFMHFLIFFTSLALGQPLRIAIIDFDNISGITKYDGLGKAMSSMLISDIESNVSPKRLQLVERAQISKIMKEQNLQKTASFDKNSVVRMGKLLGVNYLLIGDIYILDNALVINARLTDVTTGDIKFSEKQEGKLTEWLSIKSKLAKAVSFSMSMPFTEPIIPDVAIASAVLTTYANAIDESDRGSFEKAETLISTAKEFDPGFKYLDDLQDEVGKLKKQVVEQGKRIDVLEKSGGRVVGAKTYAELQLNLTNNLSSYEEKKKIFIKMLNEFPDNWEKDEGIYYNLFLKQFNFNSFSLADCNTLMNDILKTRQYVDKGVLSIYDTKMYYFLGTSLKFGARKLYFDHKFSENEYIEFKSILKEVVLNAFSDSLEQDFAKFLLLSCFVSDNNMNFRQDVKRDFLESQKNIYKRLNYSYVNQIIERCEIPGSEIYDSKFQLGLNSTINASAEIILFLAGGDKRFAKVISYFEPTLLARPLKRVHNYYFDRNANNELDIKSYLNDLAKVTEFFTVPSLYSPSTYQKNEYEDIEVFSEIPEFIKMDDKAKSDILATDTVWRRYTRIKKIVDAIHPNDPCTISMQKDILIRKSDSLALVGDVYVYNNNWPRGSRLTIIYNNGSDTGYAYIVGKKITGTKKEFEIICNDFVKNIVGNYTVLFKKDNGKLTHYDLNSNRSENNNREQFYRNIKECEENLAYVKKVAERDKLFKMQQEKSKFEKENRFLLYHRKIKSTLISFQQNRIPVDTLVFINIINDFEKDIVSLDSLFSLSWRLMSEKDFYTDYLKESTYSSRLSLSLLLNIYLVYKLNDIGTERGFWPLILNFLKASTINLGHGYMLISNHFGVKFLDLAAAEYNKVPDDFQFGENFNNLKKAEMIKTDWAEFIQKDLIPKSKIKWFNTLCSIITSI
jgi:TolB-like protein